jgi:hypothetical protein
MIAYDLVCARGHVFEGWFEDSASYREQKKKGLIACPVCNDKDVALRPSAFAIKSSQKPRPKEPSLQPQHLTRFSKELNEFIQKNFDDVGCNFAKEALKIHYGAEEPRNIRGVSTEAEEKMLRDEGIQFFKLPLPSGGDGES